MNNIYPPWWETTITLYNRYEDPQTHVVRWFRHVINGTFWKYTGNKVVVNKVTLETDDTTCRIRKDDKFLERHLWLSKPNDEMGNYFTLGVGDIIVKGEVSDIIDEYTSGLRSNDLEKKYKNLQGCIRVKEVAINTGSSRCSEHYFVKGV